MLAINVAIRSCMMLLLSTVLGSKRFNPCDGRLPLDPIPFSGMPVDGSAPHKSADC